MAYEGDDDRRPLAQGNIKWLTSRFYRRPGSSITAYPVGEWLATILKKIYNHVYS